MYRVNKRSISIIILLAVVIIGMGYFLVRYFIYGSTWASAPFNQTVYAHGVLSVGTVTDRNGIQLAGVTDGSRTFSAQGEIRRATVHAVGDREGNVGTGVLRTYAAELAGYNLITGSYVADSSTGRNITLTIDSNMNLEAYRALDGRRGVVMVSNYKTGEILCMVSNPSFDPANPPEIADDETGIYLNRGIQSAYTPGSVFKLITAAAAIENIRGIDERIFNCEGEKEIGADTLVCNASHGMIDFTSALRQSCNIAFAEIALELGSDTLSDYARKFDISGSIEIENLRSIAGNFDEAKPDTIDLAWSGVGQYTNTVCPATMLRFVGAIANNGNAAGLRYVRETGVSAVIPNLSTRLISKDTAERLGEMMEVQNRDSFPGLMIHAKSGTAQVGSDKEPHAWYTGYITNPDNPYAFVVVVENGGGGFAVAAPIANRVLQRIIG